MGIRPEGERTMETTAGRLLVAGVPLGNPGDATGRLREALASADVIAAEDTRRLRRLASDLEVTTRGRVVSYFEGNEQRRTPELADALVGGATVLLVTDAGMPSVSDPGFRLVAAAVEREVPVTVLPGPSAVTTALALSGLPCDRFCFEGFPPRKGGERRSAFAALASERRTLVFFEAPHRIAASLADLAGAFGPDRPAALCRELTKKHEETRRGSLGELAGAPAHSGGAADPAELARAVADGEASGLTRKDAIAVVAKANDLPKREVFDAVVGAKPR
jgi:16S rRNA (cytidine1402-2'-O)-methyltransferase